MTRELVRWKVTSKFELVIVAGNSGDIAYFQPNGTGCLVTTTNDPVAMAGGPALQSAFEHFHRQYPQEAIKIAKANGGTLGHLRVQYAFHVAPPDLDAANNSEARNDRLRNFWELVLDNAKSMGIQHIASNVLSVKPTYGRGAQDFIIVAMCNSILLWAETKNADVRSLTIFARDMEQAALLCKRVVPYQIQYHEYRINKEKKVKANLERILEGAQKVLFEISSDEDDMTNKALNGFQNES
mmetsp:Transcript_14936/g.26857  ORF Transcript_14936/g.26857 Transcript_14936/m.26857 type:complete len:241 (+) Transcript_14936:320-1042(+)